MNVLDGVDERQLDNDAPKVTVPNSVRLAEALEFLTTNEIKLAKPD